MVAEPQRVEAHILGSSRHGEQLREGHLPFHLGELDSDLHASALLVGHVRTVGRVRVHATVRWVHEVERRRQGWLGHSHLPDRWSLDEAPRYEVVGSRRLRCCTGGARVLERPGRAGRLRRRRQRNGDPRRCRRAVRDSARLESEHGVFVGDRRRRGSERRGAHHPRSRTGRHRVGGSFRCRCVRVRGRRWGSILRLEYARSFDDPVVPERIVEYIVRVDKAPWPPTTSYRRGHRARPLRWRSVYSSQVRCPPRRR